MLKIEIKDANLTGRKWKDGRTVFEQHAWAFIPEPNGNAAEYPQKITLRLPPESQPYAVGFYRLPPSCLYVGDFGALTIGQARLVPFSQSVSNPQKQAA